MRYDAVLFDFDGVLVDSEPIHNRCWNEILSPFGISIDWETYQRICIGVADRLMLERLAALASIPVSVDQLLATYPAKKARFRELMGRQMPFFPGIEDFIKSLSGYRLAVVTSSGRGEVEPILEQAGLLRHLGALICGDEAGGLKPSPLPYLRAAELLAAKRPLVVEDSETGVQSGVAAGFDVLRIGSPAEVTEAVRLRLAPTAD